MKLAMGVFALLVAILLGTGSSLAEEGQTRVGPSDLEQLEKLADPGATTDGTPTPNVQTYGQVIVEVPAVVGRTPGEPVTSEQAKIADYLRQAMVNRLRRHYVPTTAPGPGVAMVRTTITGLGSGQPEEPGIWSHSGATYVQAKLRAAQSRGSPLAGAVLNAEAYDTATGRLLSTTAFPAPPTTDPSTAAVDAILNGWAEEVTVWMAGSP